MRREAKKIVAIMVVIAVFICFSEQVVVPIFASTLDELRQEQDQMETELDEVNSQIAVLNSEQNEIEAQIGLIDDELVLILASMSMLEDEIAEKEVAIEEAQVEYDAALLKEQAQYEAMVVRIRCIYETGDTSYMEIFANATNFSDILNKAEYIERLYEYDQNLLESYREVKEEVAIFKAALELEQEELLTTMYEYENEKEYLDEVLLAKQEESDDYDLVLAHAKQEATAYQLLIEQQTAKINALEEEERLKAEAAAAAAAAAAASGNSSSSSSSTTTTTTTTNGATVITSATGSALGKEIAMYAIQFVGNPYVLGGTSLTDGADCSGFTYAVYQSFGYSIPRTSTAQRSAGVGVSYSEAQPGDIICYSGHVALYIGDGQIVHASTPSTGIKYGTATYKEILAVRRIV